MLILSVAGLLMGCSSDDIDLDKAPQKIAFAVDGDWQEATRTLANSTSDLQAKPFVVLGKYSSGDTYNTGALQTVFDNQEVSFDGVDWSYSPTKNWEKSSTYRFCAFWPMQTDTALDGDLSSTLTLTGFKVEPEYARQSDLMISKVEKQVTTDNVRQMTEESAEPNMVRDGISLKFRHLLCNIRFSVAKTVGTEATITVTGVKMVNVKNAATLTATSSNDGEDWADSWSAPTGAVTYNSGSISKVVPSATYNSTTEQWEWTVANGVTFDGFLVIPQTINQTGVTAADKVSLIVYYTSVSSSEGSVARNVAVDFPISDAGQVWQANKRVTYTLVINEDNAIKFGKPTVESWGTAQASGTIIIK